MKGVVSPLFILPPSFLPSLPTLLPGSFSHISARRLLSDASHQCWCPWVPALSDSLNNFFFLIICCVRYYSLTKQTDTQCTNNPKKKFKTSEFLKNTSRYTVTSRDNSFKSWFWWSAAIVQWWSMCLAFTGPAYLYLQKCLY